jgi:hypothetical protein
VVCVRRGPGGGAECRMCGGTGRRRRTRQREIAISRCAKMTGGDLVPRLTTCAPSTGYLGDGGSPRCSRDLASGGPVVAVSPIPRPAVVSGCVGLPRRSRPAWRAPRRCAPAGGGRGTGAGLEGVDGGPVLHRVDPQAGLDLTVWVSWRWRGTVSNLQPEEHDAIGWFEEGQLDGLRFADPSYLPLLRRLLSV